MTHEIVPEWSAVRAVKPPYHVDGLVVWMTPEGTLVAAAPDGTRRWQRPGFGTFHPLDGRLQWQAFGRHLYLRLPDREQWIDVVADRLMWQRSGPRDEAVLECSGRYYREIGPLEGPYQLVELDPESGDQRVMFQRPEHGNLLWIDHGRVIIARNGVVQALESNLGQVLWSTSIERRETSPFAGQAAIVRGSFTYDNLLVIRVGLFGFLALTRATGEIAWERPVVGGGAASAFAAGAHLRWLSSSHYHDVSLVDGTVHIESSVARQTSAIGVGAMTVGPNVPYADRIYAVAGNGIALCYDVPSDQFTWHASLGARSAFACTPAIAHEKLWTLDLTGALHVFDLDHA